MLQLSVLSLFASVVANEDNVDDLCEHNRLMACWVSSDSWVREVFLESCALHHGVSGAAFDKAFPQASPPPTRWILPSWAAPEIKHLEIVLSSSSPLRFPLSLLELSPWTTGARHHQAGACFPPGPAGRCEGNSAFGLCCDNRRCI